MRSLINIATIGMRCLGNGYQSIVHVPEKPDLG